MSKTLTRTRVVSEPDIYERGSGVSFFRDVLAVGGAPFPIPNTDPIEAERRLRLHSRYEADRRAKAADKGTRKLSRMGIEVRSGMAAETRALSALGGTGGELVPPTWMVDRFAGIARACCPLKSLLTRVDLPPDTLELRIPRFSSAAGVVGPMANENTNAPEVFSDTDEIKVPVATFAGDALISQQLFERGGIFSEEVVLQDFAENYGQALSEQLIAGTGTNGQLLGLLNVPTTTVHGVPGARVATYTSASPTPAGLVQTIGSVAAQVGETRKRPPSALLMRPGRYFWFAGMEAGTSQEPVLRPGLGTVPAQGQADEGARGPIAGLPVYLDGTIPVENGRDTVIALRAADLLLLEDPAGPRFTAYPTADVAGQMSVVLQWHAYTTAISSRYPSAIGHVEGSGLAVQAGF